MEKITYTHLEIKVDESSSTSDTLKGSPCEPPSITAPGEPLFIEDEPPVLVAEEGIHQDHQTRLRELASHYESGLMALNDEDMLALVLCPAGRPSKRMARIAQLIMRDGGMQGLARELVNAPFGLRRFGLAQHEILHLKMAYELVARFHLLQRINRVRIRSVYEAEKLFRAEMMHLDHEETHIPSQNTISTFLIIKTNHFSPLIQQVGSRARGLLTGREHVVNGREPSWASLLLRDDRFFRSNGWASGAKHP
jgi:hypothetical protein